MARTTASAVQALMLPGKDYDIDRAPSLTPFIDTAAALVDRVETCAVAKGKTLTSGELELIERWLAAHYYVSSDQTLASEQTERAGASYHGKTGMGLESSRYGQAALDVDYSGCLAAIGKRQSAGVTWLGKVPSEQTDYVDRS